MTKLEFIRCAASSGFDIIYKTRNDESLANIASDMRHLFSLVRINGAPLTEGNKFCLVTFNTDAALIHCIKTIPGRSGDHEDAVIIVPTQAKIQGTELKRLVEQVMAGASDAEITKLCEVALPERNIKVPCSQSQVQGNAAFRLYGGSGLSLSEIFDNLFQSYYSKYSAVFLFDKSSRNTLSGSNVIDLTDEKLQTPALLRFPLEAKNIQLKVNGEPFTADRVFSKGETVKIEYTQSMCEPIIMQLELSDEVNEVPMDKLDWKMVLKNSWFKVFDKQTQRPLNNAIIKIENKVVGKESFKLATLQNADLIVECDGYELTHEPNQNIIDKLNKSQYKIDIPLKKSPQKLSYEILDDSASGLRIVLDDKFGQYDKRVSPIPGYKVESCSGNNVYLRRAKSKSNVKYTVLIAICAFLFGAFVGIASVWAYKYVKKSKQTTEDRGNVPPNSEEENEEKLTQLQITYLKSNKTSWEKETLCSDSLKLKELWEDLVNYHYNNLLGKWNESFKNENIDGWQQIIKAVETAKEKGVEGKTSLEKRVTFETYLKKEIEEARDKSQNPPKTTDKSSSNDFSQVTATGSEADDKDPQSMNNMIGKP